MRILFVTSQWPDSEKPYVTPFVRREVDALRGVGITVDVFTYEGGWSLRAYLRAIRRLRRQLDKFHYDLVHARFGQTGLVARAQRQAPVIITYGGSDVKGSPVFAGPERVKNYLLRGTSWIVSLLVDEAIVVANHLGEKLPRTDYHVIPSGVDLDLFKPSDKGDSRHILGLPSDKKLVLFAGNPRNARKRYDLAVSACNIARNTVDIDLVVLAEKPSYEVPLYMNACDVLLVTSTNEGSPNVVKEALACNLPVVSVNVGDVKKRFGKAESCIVCEDDSPDTLAHAMECILRQPGEPRTRHLVMELEMHVLAESVVRVYEIALSNRRSERIRV